MEKIFWVFWKIEAFCPVSRFFDTSKIKKFYIFGTYTTRRSQRWVARRRKPPHAPPRAPRATTLHGASDSRALRVRSTRLTAPTAADVMLTSAWHSQQMTVMGTDVALTWLSTWLLTSACPVNKMTVMGADVALTCLSTWLMTSALAQSSFDPTRSTGQRVNPTRSTVKRTNPTQSTGQPGQRSMGQPGQRSTGSTRSNPTRSTQPSPVHALPRAAPRAEPFGGARGRV